MTRINCGIPVEELHDKHLLAEHREIVRIPNMFKSGKAKIENIPETFRLGSGHVKFFYNKLHYLLKRYIEIYKERKKRGFNVTNYWKCWDWDIPDELFNDYSPTEQDKSIVRERIAERLKSMKS